MRTSASSGRANGGISLGPTASLSTILTVLTLSGVALPGAPACAQVVINEVLYDPEGGDTGREFVELMNCGREGVLLTGWVLETGNGASPDDWTVEWIGGDLDYLEPGALFVVGEVDVLPPPDYTTPIDLQNGPDGVRLTDGEHVVDTVGWGEPLFPEYCEGTPAVDVSGGLSLARTPDCFDHDDNAFDFAGVPPTPGARNSLTDDLSLRVRHAGREVLPEGEPVRVVCVVTNVGALPCGAGAAGLRLFVDSADVPDLPVAHALVESELAPRDSSVVELVWNAPSSGYSRATVRLNYPPDGAATTNIRTTSFSVGRPGGRVAINEILHSPEEGATEWVEFVSVYHETVDVSGWLLGDGDDMFAVAADDSSRIGRAAPGGFLLAAREPDAVSGLASCPVLATDVWEALSADDTVVLADEFGTPMDIVTYERSWGGERGVSLERVRPDIGSCDAVNWGSSVSPTGNTPGRTNSIHLAVSDVSGRLVVSPNPLTPDGDGVGDRAVVSFELPVARATARLSVFDAAGRLRSVLIDQEPVSSRGEILWGGTDTAGAPLPSGLYVAFLEAIDSRAGVYVTAKTAVGIVK